MMEIGKRCLVLAAVLTIAISSAAEVQEHPADEPSWFDMSRLSDNDVHMISDEATEYVKEGQYLRDADRKMNAAEKARKDAKSAALIAKLTAPVPDPETHSTLLAQLQQELAVKTGHLGACTDKLRECGGAVELGESKKELDLSPVGPKTTAQEDWDETHNYIAPPSRPWKLRPGEKVEDVKQTALQEYKEGQKEIPTEHEPGQKFEHDRITTDQTKAMVVKAEATKSKAKADMQATKVELEKDVAAKYKVLVASEDALDSGKKHVEHLARFPSETALRTGINQTATEVQKCEDNVVTCMAEKAKAEKAKAEQPA